MGAAGTRRGCIQCDVKNFSPAVQPIITELGPLAGLVWGSSTAPPSGKFFRFGTSRVYTDAMKLTLAIYIAQSLSSLQLAVIGNLLQSLSHEKIVLIVWPTKCRYGSPPMYVTICRVDHDNSYVCFRSLTKRIAPKGMEAKTIGCSARNCRRGRLSPRHYSH